MAKRGGGCSEIKRLADLVKSCRAGICGFGCGFAGLRHLVTKSR